MNLFKLNAPVFEKPAENAGGGATSAAKTDDSSGGGDTENAGKEAVTFSADQQKALNRMLADQKKQLRAQFDTEVQERTRKAQEEAEQKKLEEQGEYKKLKDAADKARAAAEAERDQVKAQIASMLLQRSFEATVSELGLKFVNQKAAEDAFAKVDPESAGQDHAGMKEVVKQLVKDYSYYFGEAEQVPEIDATSKTNQKGKRGLTDERRSELSQRFRLPKPR